MAATFCPVVAPRAASGFARKRVVDCRSAVVIEVRFDDRRHPTMIPTRFPRTARVRARSDFDRIFKHGRRVALPVLALHWTTADTPPRLGLAVSRKVDPHAVGRNRIKRLLRETFRKHQSSLAVGDYVVVARRGAADLAPETLRQAFLDLLRRAGALPPPLATVTMPPASTDVPGKHPASNHPVD